MALVFSQTGMGVIGELVTNVETAEDLTLRIFQNDLTPTSASVVGDFTEADFTGYAAVNLTAANWGKSLASTVVLLYNTAVAFTSSAGEQAQDIYGYYVTRTTTGDLVYSERFPDGPYSIVNNGDKVSVTPRFTLVNAGA